VSLRLARRRCFLRCRLTRLLGVRRRLGMAHRLFVDDLMTACGRGSSRRRLGRRRN
jgi:hypothetical protein